MPDHPAALHLTRKAFLKHNLTTGLENFSLDRLPGRAVRDQMVGAGSPRAAVVMAVLEQPAVIPSTSCPPERRQRRWQ